MPNDETQRKTEVTTPQLMVVPGGRPDLDADAVVAQAHAAKHDQTIRVRCPLFLYNPATNNYDNWRGVSWVIALEHANQAVAFRQDLDEFMRTWVKDHRP